PRRRRHLRPRPPCRYISRTPQVFTSGELAPGGEDKAEIVVGMKDSDDDGVPDIEDPAPFDPTCPSALPCPSLPCPGDCVKLGDSDGDGVPDGQDPAPHDFYCFKQECVDADGDGVPDVDDPAPHDPECWEDTFGSERR
ncbi:unnamed protein product, partial [Prorocentrum cordatum]